MINGCLFSVRVSKRNYNPNVSRQRKTENERYNGGLLVTYTKKTEVPEIKVEEAVPSLQTITEKNLEEALHKVLSLETEPEEPSASQKAAAKTLNDIPVRKKRIAR